MFLRVAKESEFTPLKDFYQVKKAFVERINSEHQAVSGLEVWSRAVEGGRLPPPAWGPPKFPVTLPKLAG